MRHSKAIETICTALLVLLLSACGSGGGELASAPPPPPSPPSPTPAPSPGPSPLPSRLGLASDQPFATAYANPTRGTRATFDGEQTPTAPKLELRYVADSNSYEITLPGQESGRLEPYFSNGDFTASNTVPANGDRLPDGRVSLPVPGNFSSPFAYTSFGYWNAQDETPKLAGQTSDHGVFVYGIPTRSGDVPVSGQASFASRVLGYVKGGAADGFVVHGSALLDFDFGKGELTGFMNPTVPESGWAGFDYDLGRYEFTQTVFAAGATSYSGKFLVPNLPEADSSFSGIFTGPNASELLGRFEAPFLANGVGGALVGVWIGKRD